MPAPRRNFKPEIIKALIGVLQNPEVRRWGEFSGSDIQFWWRVLDDLRGFFDSDTVQSIRPMSVEAATRVYRAETGGPSGPDYLDRENPLGSLLTRGFTWDSSEQGWSYWHQVYQKLRGYLPGSVVEEEEEVYPEDTYYDDEPEEDDEPEPDFDEFKEFIV
jgi:hypothetical protein